MEYNWIVNEQSEQMNKVNETLLNEVKVNCIKLSESEWNRTKE